MKIAACGKCSTAIFRQTVIAGEIDNPRKSAMIFTGFYIILYQMLNLNGHIVNVSWFFFYSEKKWLFFYVFANKTYATSIFAFYNFIFYSSLSFFDRDAVMFIYRYFPIYCTISTQSHAKYLSYPIYVILIVNSAAKGLRFSVRKRLHL